MGYNLILVDINAEGLAETKKIVEEEVASSSALAEEMKKRLKMLEVVQDLSQMDAADRIYEKTEEAGCEVEVLVNNAGVMK